MARVISVANPKGGVGKTTVATGLAAAAAADEENEPRVLLIDLDVNGSATTAVGRPDLRTMPEGMPTLASELRGTTDVGLDKVAVPIEFKVDGRTCRYDFIPSQLAPLTEAEEVIATRAGREMTLARKLRAVADQYDLIFLDLPGHVCLLADMGLVAAAEGRYEGLGGGGVIIVAQPHAHLVSGLLTLLDQLQAIADGLELDLPVTGVVVDMIDDTLAVRDALAELEHPDVAADLPIIGRIRVRTSLRDAWRLGRPIIEFRPNEDASLEFRRLARHLITQEQAA